MSGFSAGKDGSSWLGSIAQSFLTMTRWRCQFPPVLQHGTASAVLLSWGSSVPPGQEEQHFVGSAKHQQCQGVMFCCSATLQMCWCRSRGRFPLPHSQKGLERAREQRAGCPAPRHPPSIPWRSRGTSAGSRCLRTRDDEGGDSQHGCWGARGTFPYSPIPLFPCSPVPRPFPTSSPSRSLPRGRAAEGVTAGPQEARGGARGWEPLRLGRTKPPFERPPRPRGAPNCLGEKFISGSSGVCAAPAPARPGRPLIGGGPAILPAPALGF